MYNYIMYNTFLSKEIHFFSLEPFSRPALTFLTENCNRKFLEIMAPRTLKYRSKWGIKYVFNTYFSYYSYRKTPK